MRVWLLVKAKVEGIVIARVAADLPWLMQVAPPVDFHQDEWYRIVPEEVEGFEQVYGLARAEEILRGIFDHERLAMLASGGSCPFCGRLNKRGEHQADCTWLQTGAWLAQYGREGAA